VDVIREGVVSIADMHHARHVVDIIESAYASAASGKTISLRPTAYQPLPLERLAKI